MTTSQVPSPDIEQWRKVHQMICWLAEAGFYSSSGIVDAIESKIRFSHPTLHDIVKRIFLSFAECRFAYIQCDNGFKGEFRLIPTVDPHAFARFLQMRVDNLSGIRPEPGQRVRFSVWDGLNAPDDLSKWSGTVTDKISNGLFMEYVIVRDFDQERIKLARKFLLRA